MQVNGVGISSLALKIGDLGLTEKVAVMKALSPVEQGQLLRELDGIKQSNRPDSESFVRTKDPINSHAYLGSSSIMSRDQTVKYEEDVHRDLTAVLALAAGAPPAVANQIANSDQGVDDNPATSPMGMSPFGNAVQVRADYHFTSTDRRVQMYQEFVTAGNAATLGRYLHAHQDSYSHEGYGARIGHIRHGHEPDKTYNNVDKANGMAMTTYNVIARAKGAVSANGKAIPWGKTASWSKIAPAVNEFNTATTAVGKNAALAKIKGLLVK